MRKYQEGTAEFNKTLGEETLNMFDNLLDIQFPVSSDYPVKCMREVRSRVDLYIAERESIRLIIEERNNNYDNEISQYKEKLNDYRRNDLPKDEAFYAIEARIKSLTDEKEGFRKEYSVPDFENGFLGMYTRNFPLLEIYNRPTIVLFYDSIEASSYGEPKSDRYTIVYAHELFHAFFDSPEFNKNPDPKLEETMAQFGMHTLLEMAFGVSNIVNKAISMSTGYMDQHDGKEYHFEYYYGLVLYDQTIKGAEKIAEKDIDAYRFRYLTKYRYLSNDIKLPPSSNYVHGYDLYKNSLYDSEILNKVRDILNYDYWYNIR